MIAAALIYQAQEERPFMVQDSYIEDKERLGKNVAIAVGIGRDNNEAMETGTGKKS